MTIINFILHLIVRTIVVIFNMPRMICLGVVISYFRFKYEKKAIEAVQYVANRPYNSDTLVKSLDDKMIELGIDNEQYRKAAVTSAAISLSMRNAIVTKTEELVKQAESEFNELVGKLKTADEMISEVQDQIQK